MKRNQKKIMALVMAVALVGSGFTSVQTDYSKVFAVVDNFSIGFKVDVNEEFSYDETVNYTDSNGKSVSEIMRDEAEYSLDGDTLYISGSNYINAAKRISYSSFNCNCDLVKSIVVGNGVQILGKECFCTGAEPLFKNVESITLPSSLEVICSQSLSYLPSLKELTIPSGVDSISDYAISFNTSLKKLTVNTLVSIPKYMVYFCNSLENITLKSPGLIANPDNTDILKSKRIIGERAFNKNNQEVTYVEFPNNITEIGACAFDNGNYYFKDVYIPYGMTTIGNFAFNKNTINSLQIEGADKIDDSAFYETKGFDSFSIKRVKEIGLEAFAFSEIKELDLTNCTDIIIGRQAFRSCTSLEEVIFPLRIESIGDSVFSYCENLKTVKMPSLDLGIKNIPDFTFQCCKKLTDITLPKDLESIGVAAFGECTSLKNVQLPEKLKSIEKEAFSRCSSLESIELPDSLTTIGSNAFEGTNFETINIPGSVKVIDSVIGNKQTVGNTKCSDIVLNSGSEEIVEKAFKNNIQLKSITIPESVTKIGKDAFENCPELTIYGVTGSAAEKYAAENNIPFVDKNKKEATTTEAEVTEAPVTTANKEETSETTAASQTITSATTKTTSAATTTTDKATSAVTTAKVDETTTAVTITEKVMYVGDIDGNGITDLTDLSWLSVKLMERKIDVNTNPCADIDQNGVVDIADLARLKQYISKDQSVKDLGIVKKK